MGVHTERFYTDVGFNILEYVMLKQAQIFIF